MSTPQVDRSLYPLRIFVSILIFLCLGNLASAETPLVVVRSTAFAEVLNPWISLRKQQGFAVYPIEPKESAEATRSAIQAEISKHTVINARVTSNETRATEDFKDRAASTPVIVLVGDAPNFSRRDSSQSSFSIPTFYVESEVVKKFGSEPTIASDQLYADWNDDGTPEAIVGRIPASNAEELDRYLQRVIGYESNPHRGTWRRDIQLVAGIGNFGVLADTLIEGVTRQLIARDLPETFRLQLTHASQTSPYFPSTRLFTDAVIQQLNGGSLFWVYVGHGQITALDSILVGSESKPILDDQSIHRIDIQRGPPVGLLLACYTSAFDANRPCFAENLLLQTNGPLVLLGSSRVAMPYGMANLASELMKSCFEKKLSRIGEIHQHSKASLLSPETQDDSPDSIAFREMMDAMANALSPEGHSLASEKREHTFLFNLLGDPCLSITLPKEIVLSAPTTVAAGGNLAIRGTSPIGGKLVVELNYKRNRIPESVRQASNSTNPPSDAELLLRQQAANSLSLVYCEKMIDDGTDFQVSLPVPADCRGSYNLTATIWGDHDWAAACKTIRIAKVSANEPKPSAKVE